MRALLVGSGSIGRRHCSNLRELVSAARVLLLRRPGRLLPDGFSGLAECVHDWGGVRDFGPEVAIVAGPASEHVGVARQCLELGCHLFLEKPLAHEDAGLDELEQELKHRDRIAFVGYNFRFYRPLLALREALRAGWIGQVQGAAFRVGQYLPDWRPGLDSRESVSAQRNLGGGALLELSHEIDLARWLLGEPTGVFARLKRVGEVTVDVEDCADLLLEFEDGVQATVHLDMLQRVAERGCRIFGSTGTLVWNLNGNRVEAYSAETGGWSTLFEAEELDRNDMYREELRHFLALVRGTQTENICTLADARRTLAVALAARESNETGRLVAL